MITKIHIVGASGSGKSTLAKELREVVHCLCWDLDVVAYENGVGGFGKKLRRQFWLDHYVNSIITPPRWISEGIYLTWAKPLFYAADLIIWLDIPYPIVAFRVIRRHYRRSKAGTNKYKGIGRLALFLFWIARYYYSPFPDPNPTRKATKRMLEGFNFVRVTNNKDLEKVKELIIG